MSTTLDFRSSTWRLDFSAKGISLGSGRRVWIGGDPDLLGSWDHNQSEPHEVLIPPGRCVYYWLGCEAERSEGTYCAEHYKENEELEEIFRVSDRAHKLEVRRNRKKELRADPTVSTRNKPEAAKARVRKSRATDQQAYYERHKDEINRKKREARKAGTYVS